MSEYIFEVSKEGYDVLTAADKEKVYSSKRVGLKIRKKIAISVTADIQAAVAHGLNYKPAAFGFQADDTHGVMFPNVQFPGFDLIDDTHTTLLLNVWTDSNSVYVNSTQSGTVYVFLITERGSNA
jgi:hypothetical protein